MEHQQTNATGQSDRRTVAATARSAPVVVAPTPMQALEKICRGLGNSAFGSFIQARLNIGQAEESESEESESTKDSVESLPAGGEPLSESRDFFEPRFGSDLSGVRAHSDLKAAKLARSIGARAFTSEQNIYFGANEYRPDHREGRELLAHELAHTRRQAADSS